MASTDLERLDALLAEQETAIRDAFAAYVATVGTDGPTFDAIIVKLEQHDLQGALAIVDSYIAHMGNVIPVVMQTVGVATAAELASVIPTPAVAISFDPSFPRAAEIIRSNRAKFVKDFTDGQRKAVAQSLARSYQRGEGTEGAARAFRDAIGLTPAQEQAVANYQRLLEEGSREALNRELRDRRFDRTVARAIENDRSLTPDQVARMVARYRERFVASRAATIARTEGVRATSMAREEALDQMIEQTGTPVARIERIWNPLNDTRVRDWHATMEGQTVGRNEPFVDGLGNSLMYPGDPEAAAETVINCRCGLTFNVKPPR